MQSFTWHTPVGATLSSLFLLQLSRYLLSFSRDLPFDFLQLCTYFLISFILRYHLTWFFNSSTINKSVTLTQSIKLNYKKKYKNFTARSIYLIFRRYLNKNQVIQRRDVTLILYSWNTIRSNETFREFV